MNQIMIIMAVGVFMILVSTIMKHVIAIMIMVSTLILAAGVRVIRVNIITNFRDYYHDCGEHAHNCGGCDHDSGEHFH